MTDMLTMLTIIASVYCVFCREYFIMSSYLAFAMLWPTKNFTCVVKKVYSLALYGFYGVAVDVIKLLLFSLNWLKIFKKV